jgi:hypothetical protein
MLVGLFRSWVEVVRWPSTLVFRAHAADATHLRTLASVILGGGQMGPDPCCARDAWRRETDVVWLARGRTSE